MTVSSLMLTQVHPASVSPSAVAVPTTDYSTTFPIGRRPNAPLLTNGCRVPATTSWRGTFNVIKEDINGGEVGETSMILVLLSSLPSSSLPLPLLFYIV